MAYLEVNGHDVTDGFLDVPRIGRAIAEFRLATPFEEVGLKAGDAVTAIFEDGTEYAMAVQRVGELRGLTAVRLVAGSGGLSKTVPAKFYGDGIQAADAVKDLLREVAEAAGTIDMPGTLKHWPRLNGSAIAALNAFLLPYPTRFWRVDRAGKVQIGEAAWPDGKAFEVIERQPTSARVIALPVPSLEPGTKTEAGRIDRVTFRIGPKLRMEVLTDD